MANYTTICSVKTDLRISHNHLDDNIGEAVDSCLADLSSSGVTEADENDSLVLAAIKTYCRAEFCDDAVKAEIYLGRYEKQKAHMMTADGYGYDSKAVTK